MIDILDGPEGEDDWGCIDWDKEEIYYDLSGGRKPLTCNEVMITRGKYANSLMSEVDDTWYLKFIRDKNLDDGLIQLVFNKRIKELE